MEKLYEDKPEGCILFQTSLDVLRNMTDEKAGKAVKAMADYFLDGSVWEDTDETVRLITLMLRRDADKSFKRYNATCERNRKNAARKEKRDAADAAEIVAEEA